MEEKGEEELSRVSWNADKVLSEINHLVNKNVPLNINYIRNNHNNLLCASKRYFGGWKEALEKLDIDYEKIKEETKLKNTKWSNEKIINELKKNQDKKIIEILKQYKNLYDAAAKYFGSFENAVRAAGLDYEKMRTDTSKFTKDELIHKLKDSYRKGEQVNDAAFRKNHKEYYHGFSSYFSSYKDFVEAAGLNYDEISLKKANGYWTGHRVISDIKQLKKEDFDLSMSHVSKNNGDLYAAAQKYFGNWEEALKRAGISYEDFRKVQRWNKELVLEKLKTFSKKENPNENNIRKKNPALMKAIRRYYGELKTALELIGIEYDNIRLTKEKGYWSKEKVIQTIQEYHENDFPLNSMYAKKYYSGMYTTAGNLFGSWEKAVIASGINFNHVRNDIDTTRYCGYRFQTLVSELLTELRIPFENKTIHGLKPDFILKDYHVLDAKLSEWTIAGSPTLEKYEPVFKFITLVYMRESSNSKLDVMITNKTRNISVYKFIKQLPRSRQTYYIRKIDELNNYLNEIEKMPVKITITFKGETGDVDYWAKKMNVTTDTIIRNYRKGKMEGRIAKFYDNFYEWNGIKKTLKEWSEFLGVGRHFLIVWKENGTIDERIAFHLNKMQKPDLDVNLIKKMFYEDRKTLKEISGYFKVSKDTIKRRLKEEK
ncbi:hypothetical protein [Neobacillus sp. Marseille-QA0830]